MALSINNELIERFTRQLDKATKIVILSHMNPDGDAVGSSLAMYHWLRESFFAGREAPLINILLPHSCPHDMCYLPAADTIMDAERNKSLCIELIDNADLIVGVDFNNASRVLPLDNALVASKAPKILIDHHHKPDEALFTTLFSLPDLSSTCELLYWLFSQTIGDNSITDNVARCLYHGINTDTGGFSYSCDDPSLYEATAALMHHPIDAAGVHNRIFNNYSVEKMRLLGFLLSNRMKIIPQKKAAIIYVSADDLSSHNCTPYDLEGLVNYTLMMEEIEVGIMIKEAEGKVRLSFRSKYDFDVNAFAGNLFGGGGHLKASGATSPYGMEKTMKIVEEALLTAD